MIKTLNIQNFESHENTTVHFTDNFNLIIGKSDTGKSSIIRALGVIVNNKWDKEMVRSGFDFCRIKVETDKGWVQCERGEKVNRWKCQQNNGQIQNYKNVGIGVPDLVTKILGMGERDRGGDLKELPNFQFQLQRHYMLSQIGQKKSTSNMIARMMDNAIGLGGMEDLIKGISTDLLKDKKWLTQKQNEIVDLKTSILDENIFNNYKKLINKISKLFESLQEMENNINIADNYKNKYDKINNKKLEIDEIINNIPDVNKLIKLIKKIDNLDKSIKIIEKINNINIKLNNINKIKDIKLNNLQKKLKDYEKEDKIINLIIDINDIEEKLSNINDIRNCNFDKIDNLLNNINKLNNKIEDADKLLNNARNIWKYKSNADKQLKQINKELISAEKEFQELKDKLGVCPLCGGKLS